MGMESSDNPTLQTKPFYKRPKIYGIAVISTLFGLLLLLLTSIIVLRWVNPPVTSFTYQQNWEELNTERYSLRDQWVHYEDLPDHAAWAVIAAEDQLFWEHKGFDIESIREAWEERQEGEGSRGASSITQQVAKNLFLWPAESFFRKGIEAGITIVIELFWPKERIMEMYLNIAEFGPGVFGIGKASQQFYDRPANELEPEMSARLAAVLPSPKRMRVNPPSPFTKERSGWILRQMTQLSGIAYLPETAVSDTISEPEFSSSEADTVISVQIVNSSSLSSESTSISPAFDHQTGTDSLEFKPVPDSIP